MKHQLLKTSSQLERAEPRNKEVIKSPSKLLSLKFQEQSSLKMFNERTSSPKRVHFVNTITLVKKESRDVAPIEQENLTKSKKLESSKVSGEINNDDFEEEEDEEDGYLESFNTSPSIEALEYHEWLLKNPRPHWVRAKIRTGSLHNIKISCMIGHILKRQAYIDFESPINIMSIKQYKQIMSQKLKPRQKPLNPSKKCNFVGMAEEVCDFMVLEDTTSIMTKRKERSPS
ncbi:hypothetical protein Tco_1563571 [Tanacetum coccineum]